VMTAFPQLKNEEIDAIIKYVNEYKAPGATAAAGGAASTTSTDDNAWIYTLATFGMLMLAIILWRVNAGLKRVAAEKVGGPVDREVPLWRSKFVIAIVAILVTI